MLIGVDREIFKPCDLVIGEEILHSFKNSNEPQVTYNEIIDTIYNFFKCLNFERKRNVC